jgi:hypothetical protein
MYSKENQTCRVDTAVTDDGPDFIKGNLNWDKVIWQRSAKRDLKPLINSYI